MLKLRERNYYSRFDQRHSQPQKRVVPEYDRQELDIRRHLFKWGPWVAFGAVGWWAFDYFIL